MKGISSPAAELHKRTHPRERRSLLHSCSAALISEPRLASSSGERCSQIKVFISDVSGKGSCTISRRGLTLAVMMG